MARIVDEVKRKFAERGRGVEADGGAIVDDPVGATGKEFGIPGGGADGEDAATGGFAGADAGRGVFDDDALSGGNIERGGSLEIRLGIRLAMLDVTGRNHVADERKNARSTKTDFCKFADGGGDDRKAFRRELGEQLTGARQSDNVGDILYFGALHSEVFREVNFVGGMGEEFLDADEAGASVGALDNSRGVEAVLVGPGLPDAGHSGCGIDKNAVHIEEQGRAANTGHWAPGIQNKYCGAKTGGKGRAGRIGVDLVHRLS